MGTGFGPDTRQTPQVQQDQELVAPKVDRVSESAALRKGTYQEFSAKELERMVKGINRDLRELEKDLRDANSVEKLDKLAVRQEALDQRIDQVLSARVIGKTANPYTADSFYVPDSSAPEQPQRLTPSNKTDSSAYRQERIQQAPEYEERDKPNRNLTIEDYRKSTYKSRTYVDPRLPADIRESVREYWEEKKKSDEFIDTYRRMANDKNYVPGIKYLQIRDKYGSVDGALEQLNRDPSSIEPSLRFFLEDSLSIRGLRAWEGFDGYSKRRRETSDISADLFRPGVKEATNNVVETRRNLDEAIEALSYSPKTSNGLSDLRSVQVSLNGKIARFSESSLNAAPNNELHFDNGISIYRDPADQSRVIIAAFEPGTLLLDAYWKGGNSLFEKGPRKLEIRQSTN